MNGTYRLVLLAVQCCHQSSLFITHLLRTQAICEGGGGALALDGPDGDTDLNITLGGIVEDVPGRILQQGT